ncbi:MAG: HDIG domain-containing protein [Bacteroidia bacterium]|jgi:putative nucleotidyltransferase with HDIG domain|nr:HDIG domain-containing protein [Bacteroidales bacterium]MDY0286948.1 HDIG domain-containing protein [Bacteroidales bacterium]NCD42535.1 HDIG domain-containing protein [Bacteroidia bacterium]
MKRNQALEALYMHIKSESLRKHSLASEAVMRALAEKMGQDKERWGLAGLLHDIDVEITGADPKTHGIVGANMLAEMGFDQEFVDAVRLHNEEATGIPRATLFQHALSAGETITGLITATTLVYPDKKIASVKPKSIVKRMKEKAFAASVNRDCIMECEKIGIPLPEFAELALNAMQAVSDDLGL